MSKATQQIQRLLNWVKCLSKNPEQRTKNCFTKRTQNVGDLSLPKGEASVLHNIEIAKRTQFPAFPIKYRRLPKKRTQFKPKIAAQRRSRSHIGIERSEIPTSRRETNPILTFP
jgi:hypothetical protein